MRAKYARQIRRGVLAAKAAVVHITGDPSAPIFFPKNFTDLEHRAFTRTLTNLVAREVIASGKRVIAKVQNNF